ncbi:MAG TPA: hypothetical protein VN947_26055 [Polyangia bacterium]|nr:hypothetical protein [Polyangia bacterium]
MTGARAAVFVVAVALIVVVLGYFLARGLHPSPAPIAPKTPPPPAPAIGAAQVDLGHPTAPASPSGAARSPRAHVVLSAAWGAAPGQLGRRVDPESLAVGPMSFFVDAHGVVVLDNVNRRLARFDANGRPLPPIALDSDAAQDLARSRDRVAVLDRLHDKRVTLYDADGSVRASLPLTIAGISDGAAATGVFADRDGALYVEREHGAWMPLADASGDPARGLKAAPGRPTRDGRFVAAAIADRASGRATVTLWGSAAPPPAWQVTVGFGAPVMFIALLDSDANGRIYIGAHTGREAATPPYAITDESLTIVALDPDDGHERARLTLPAPPPREESFRDLYVGDDGTIYWMRRTAAGVVVEAYRL